MCYSLRRRETVRDTSHNCRRGRRGEAILGRLSYVKEGIPQGVPRSQPNHGVPQPYLRSEHAGLAAAIPLSLHRIWRVSSGTACRSASDDDAREKSLCAVWCPVVKRAYKFRAYPTRQQENRSVSLLRDHCELYDAALQERRDAYRMRKVSISFYDQSAQLPSIRRADPDGQGRHSSAAQQHTLRRLNRAFDAFFRRCKNGETPGYPRFKPASRFNQVMFVNGNGAKWESGDRWGHATFQAVGCVKVKQHRRINGRVKTLQLVREYRRWYVVLVADVDAELLPSTGRSIGVDVGVARFLTTSDGEIVDNPRFLAVSQKVINDLQRQKDRARKGSGNRRRVRGLLAREHRKVVNRRRDFHHKTARRLINSCDVIGFEKLRITNMTRKPKPKPDPDNPGQFLPNGAAAKSGLNRSILDAGWGQFINIVTAKAESAGRRIVLVNPAGTSINCHRCGARCHRPQQDTVICPSCGPMDADLNGARNVSFRAGLGSDQATAA